jgi:hypothetical protein
MLFYGDNLDVLQKHVGDESVDLIYLDPPFNSNRSYNVLFKTRSGDDAQAQIEAFDDSWTWDQHSEQQYIALIAIRAAAMCSTAPRDSTAASGDTSTRRRSQQSTSTPRLQPRPHERERPRARGVRSRETHTAAPSAQSETD